MLGETRPSSQPAELACAWCSKHLSIYSNQTLCDEGPPSINHWTQQSHSKCIHLPGTEIHTYQHLIRFIKHRIRKHRENMKSDLKLEREKIVNAWVLVHALFGPWKRNVSCVCKRLEDVAFVFSLEFDEFPSADYGRCNGCPRLGTGASSPITVATIQKPPAATEFMFYITPWNRWPRLYQDADITKVHSIIHLNDP